MGRDTLMNYLLPAAAFVMIAAVWIAALMVLTARRRRLSAKMHRRIGLIRDADQPVRMLRLWHEGQEAVTFVPGMPRRGSAVNRFGQLCRPPANRGGGYQELRGIA